MKNIILITLLLLISQFSISQKKFKIDNDSFMIGMFNDYCGREIALDHPLASTQVTYFYCSEKKLEKRFLDSIQKNYNSKDIITKNYVIYSKSLSTRFNKYYNIKKDDSAGFVYDDIDYPSYMLTLKRSSFSLNNQKISFILGTYLRNGEINNGKLLISMANSISHFDVLIWSMKKLGFNYKKEIPCPDCIPVGQIVYFEPPKDYLFLFQNITPFKPDLNDCN